MDTIEKALRKHENSKPQTSTATTPEELESQSEHDYIRPKSDLIDRAGEQTETLGGSDATSASSAPLGNKVAFKEGYGSQKIDLDLAGLARSGVIIPDDKRSKIKEEYKHIKRPLLQKAAMNNAAVDRKNLIMVTSAHSGEGKTFSSLNLAMSIAVERDRRVLLMDADVVKPGLGKMLSLNERPGLVEYLNGDVDQLSDIMLSTNVHNLTLMPAGRTHHLSHELLASNTMSELADELSTRYSDRIVIFDSPPLLATSEAKVLSRLVGQIVLVVEQDKTAQDAVQAALANVEKEKVTGLILNKSRSGRDSYYGYYYSDEN